MRDFRESPRATRRPCLATRNPPIKESECTVASNTGYNYHPGAFSIDVDRRSAPVPASSGELPWRPPNATPTSGSAGNRLSVILSAVAVVLAGGALVAGLDGHVGPAGPAGAAGPTGPTGNQGPGGPQGRPVVAAPPERMVLKARPDPRDPAVKSSNLTRSSVTS